MKVLRKFGFPLVLTCSLCMAWSVSTIAADLKNSKDAVKVPEAKESKYQDLELFQKIIHFVETNYVDETDHKKLMEGAIKGMLETLDPHTVFFSPEAFREMKTDTSGKFGGLGIEVTMQDNLLTIISPIEDTPAWRAGIKPGDRIVKINGESTKGMDSQDCLTKLRGKNGTTVNLSIYREGASSIRDFIIKRELIKIDAVKDAQILESEYGYARLTAFNENAASELGHALDKLEKTKKLKGLILDLRMNPGGLLDQAVDVTSLFLDEGVVVSTIGRNKDQKEVKYAKPGKARKYLQVAILVGASTASAAEIVAGALQDHKRAIVLGQPTFGKGSVQTLIDLGKDMGLKLTIARYFTPSGRSIQEKGVVPDLLLEDYDLRKLAKAKKTREFLRERDLKGHIKNPDEQTTTPGDQDGSNSKEASALSTDSGGQFGMKKRSDFNKDELDAILSSKKKGKNAEEDAEFDDGPEKFYPKEDFQVREALNTLKGFDVYKRFTIKSE